MHTGHYPVIWVEFKINFALHVRHAMNYITHYFCLGFIRRKSVIRFMP